jgi:hypothetical protein
MPRRSLKVVAEGMVAKMECLWKPAQSGKTRTIQQMIREDDGVRNHLNIIICSNNRLLVAQTRTRMHNDLYDDDSLASFDSEGSVDADDSIVGGVYSWMSGTKKTNIDHEALAWKILKGEVSMIVCCPNKVRLDYLRKLLGELESSPFAKPVNVWIDEADASVKTWSTPQFDFTRFNCVRKVTLVSATFDEVFKFYRKIRVKAFPETHPSCYRGLRNCTLVEESAAPSAALFLAAMLDKHRDTLVRPGVRLFTPGDITVESHDEVAKELTYRGFAILMLNGQEKGFRLPDGRIIPIELSASNEEDPDELCRVLAQHYRDLGLERWPFAVTGHLCLSRGITFQSRDFLFDAGILPTIGNAAAAYQCVARVLGNIGDFSAVRPTIYMSPEMKAATTRQERIAVNLARLVHEKEWAEVGEEEVARASFDTEAEYEAARAAAAEKKATYNDDDYEVAWSREFASLEELVTSKATKGRRPEMGEDGFYKNATGGKKPMTREQFSAFKGGKKTSNMRQKLEVGEASTRTYPFYEDATDPSTIRFAVKTLTRIR